MTKSTSYNGNKANLPSKLCLQCDLVITWRTAWAKNWNEVKYYSDACRHSSKNNNPKHRQAVAACSDTPNLLKTSNVL